METKRMNKSQQPIKKPSQFIPPSSSDCEAYLESLPSRSKDELYLLWRKVLGTQPVHEMRRELLEPVLAYKLRERIYGGLKPAVRAELLRIRNSLHPGPKTLLAAKDRFSTNTRILREWGGQVHEVKVMATGYLYRTETYNSLSAIARRITGTQWSGPAFFGIKEKAVRK